MKHHTTRRLTACLMAATAMLSCLPAARSADVNEPALRIPRQPARHRCRQAAVVLEDRRPEIKGQRSEVRNKPPIRCWSPRSPELLAKDQGDLWDSGKVASDQSIQVEYAGKPLESGRLCHWKVRVWDKDGKPSAWSAPAGWSMGLLDARGLAGEVGQARPLDFRDARPRSLRLDLVSACRGHRRDAGDPGLFPCPPETAGG